MADVSSFQRYITQGLARSEGIGARKEFSIDGAGLGVYIF